MIDDFLNRMILAVPDGFFGMLILLAVTAASLYVLGKGADILVNEAVTLSTRWGVPKMVIGATVVSLGTTLPEVTVSVMATLQGSPNLAMGNAVGSIICDTGLILGIAALIKPLPFRRNVVNLQGWVQLGAALLLVVSTLIFGLSAGNNVFKEGGRLPQFMGFVFLALLVIYMVYTIRHSRSGGADEEASDDVDSSSTAVVLLKMLLGIVLVICSSKILIPTVQEIAIRLHIPETVIAATLVAFGTSLPELITAITAARKGVGDLAIGNIIGADILNVLFVVGASCAVTKGGLYVAPNFFYLLFPTMLFVLCVFKGGVIFSKDSIKRPVGIVLLAAYIFSTVLSYVV